MFMYRNNGKRLFDIFFASVTLLILAPIFILVTIAIWFEDQGAALFRQERVGRLGTSFTINKFRSMPLSTKQVPSTKTDSISITKVGKLIRRTNIDELPQLLNIVAGHMSLIGPRPALKSQEELCSLRVKNGASDCRPGLTGLAQINSYDGMPEYEKARWDGEYSKRITFFSDLTIILKTFRYLLKPPPTY